MVREERVFLSSEEGKDEEDEEVAVVLNANRTVLMIACAPLAHVYMGLTHRDPGRGGEVMVSSELESSLLETGREEPKTRPHATDGLARFPRSLNTLPWQTLAMSALMLSEPTSSVMLNERVKLRGAKQPNMLSVLMNCGAEETEQPMRGRGNSFPSWDEVEFP